MALVVFHPGFSTSHVLLSLNGIVFVGIRHSLQLKRRIEFNSEFSWNGLKLHVMSTVLQFYEHDGCWLVDSLILQEVPFLLVCRISF